MTEYREQILTILTMQISSNKEGGHSKCPLCAKTFPFLLTQFKRSWTNKENNKLTTTKEDHNNNEWRSWQQRTKTTAKTNDDTNNKQRLQWLNNPAELASLFWIWTSLGMSKISIFIHFFFSEKEWYKWPEVVQMAQNALSRSAPKSHYIIPQNVSQKLSQMYKAL